MSTVQDELMHYGVLGMKWGKSNKQSTGNSNSVAKKKKERTPEEQEKHKVNVKLGKEITATLLAGGLGAFSAHSLLSMTDVSLSSTGMYVGTLIGGFLGAKAVDGLFD